MRAIARRLQRSPSTISRELQRNAGCSGQPYRATTAHALAYERAGRPKPSKLATNLALRKKVEQDLQRRYSPEQIAGRLGQEFPQNAEMRVSTETIYQSVYVQSRGASAVNESVITADTTRQLPRIDVELVDIRDVHAVVLEV